MACTECELGALQYYALQGAEDKEDEAIVEHVMGKIRGSNKESVKMADMFGGLDIPDLLGVKGDDLKVTVGGVGAEMYEDTITEKFSEWANKVSADYAGAVAKLIPAVLIKYGTKKFAGGDMALIGEGASFNLRVAAYADLLSGLKSTGE